MAAFIVFLVLRVVSADTVSGQLAGRAPVIVFPGEEGVHRAVALLQRRQRPHLVAGETGMVPGPGNLALVLVMNQATTDRELLEVEDTNPGGDSVQESMSDAVGNRLRKRVAVARPCIPRQGASGD